MISFLNVQRCSRRAELVGRKGAPRPDILTGEDQNGALLGSLMGVNNRISERDPREKPSDASPMMWWKMSSWKPEPFCWFLGDEPNRLIFRAHFTVVEELTATIHLLPSWIRGHSICAKTKNFMVYQTSSQVLVLSTSNNNELFMPRSEQLQYLSLFSLNSEISRLVDIGLDVNVTHLYLHMKRSWGLTFDSKHKKRELSGTFFSLTESIW